MRSHHAGGASADANGLEHPRCAFTPPPRMTYNRAPVNAVPTRKRLKRFLRYGAVRAAWGIAGHLPLGWVPSWARVLGDCAFAVAGAERAKALRSLQRAYPELPQARRVQIARACFRHLARCALELACVRQVDARLESYVRWPDADRRVLEGALARGRGVVFVSGHVGNWELLARRVALAGYPSQSIAKETSDPRLTAMIERLRRGGRVGSIWRGQNGAAKQMLRALRAGEILGLVIDQDTRVQSVFVPFFGVPAATPRAAADLALRTGAAVVTGFCQREAEGGYALSMREVPVIPTGDAEADAVALTAVLTAEIEAAVRRAPEQWVWMHQRWKTRPLAAFLGLALGLGCASKTPPREEAPPPSPRVALYGVKVQSFQGSRLAMTGRAAQLTYDRRSGQVEAAEVFSRFHRSEDAAGLGGNVGLRTPSITGNLADKQADAREGIVLQAANGQTGSARNGHYDGTRRLAHGEGPVELKGPVFSVTSRSYLIDFNEERFDFEGDVEALTGAAR